jgi:signal transduction histidine kinase
MSFALDENHQPPKHKHTWQRRRFGRLENRVLRRRFLFYHFASVFSAMVFLIVGGGGLSFWFFFQAINRSYHFWWFVGSAAMLVCPVLGWSLAIHAFQEIIQPLAGMMNAADAIAQGDLHARVAESSPGAFGHLARTFNHMTITLEQNERQRQRLMADIAHELRTPVHILQGNLEGVIDGIYLPSAERLALMLEETQNLTRLIEDIRMITLLESDHLPLSPTILEIEALLNRMKERFHSAAAKCQVAIQVSVDDPMTVWADPLRLEQVIGNLIMNALQHTPAKGTITLHAFSRLQRAHILIEDTGNGIAPEDLPHLFDRFWSQPHGKQGHSGLGLAIAKELTQAHKGTIFASSVLGTGTTITIELPLATSYP